MDSVGYVIVLFYYSREGYPEITQQRESSCSDVNSIANGCVIGPLDGEVYPELEQPRGQDLVLGYFIRAESRQEDGRHSQVLQRRPAQLH